MEIADVVLRCLRQRRVRANSGVGQRRRLPGDLREQLSDGLCERLSERLSGQARQGGLSIALAASTLLMLTGCFGPTPVPITDQSSTLIQPEPVRVVRHGETLYSIAWSTGKDPEEIARLNKLQQPYRVRPGQKLKLDGPSTKPANTSLSKPLAKRGQRAVRKAKPKSKTSDAGPDPSSWVWPAQGKIVASFSPKEGRKGIDIHGPAGSAVRSSASGRVVYAGGGLRGFGRLVIVKHGAHYLSAYGHNRKLYVAEGEWVTAGQPIGEMGTVHQRNPQLHFEIRRDGKPVDPRRYLPKR